jgi:(2R)-sulfolactate sulfo-lyase subunit alpha
MPNEAEPPDFLVHRAGDSVAVAVRDLSPGIVRGGYLSGSDQVGKGGLGGKGALGGKGGLGGEMRVELAEAVPLGHKFALHQIPRGGDVIEYGVRVAVATTDIAAGQHAHVHNLRSARWHSSVAS